MLGRDFLAAVRAAMEAADTLPLEDWQSGEWADLPGTGGGYISADHCGGAGVVVLGILPAVARQLRDEYGGAGGVMHFALLEDGRFAIILEGDQPFTLAHVEGYDFVGGRRAVYYPTPTAGLAGPPLPG